MEYLVPQSTLQLTLQGLQYSNGWLGLWELSLHYFHFCVFIILSCILIGHWIDCNSKISHSPGLHIAKVKISLPTHAVGAAYTKATCKKPSINYRSNSNSNFSCLGSDSTIVLLIVANIKELGYNCTNHELLSGHLPGWRGTADISKYHNLFNGEPSVRVSSVTITVPK